jgi:hypothetical protein
MVGQVAFGFAVVPLGDEIEERLACSSCANNSSTTLQLTEPRSRLVVNEWPSRGPSGPQAPERAQLLAPIRVLQAQAGKRAGLVMTRTVSPSSTASTSQSRPSSVTTLPGTSSSDETNGCTRSFPSRFTLTISYSNATC